MAASTETAKLESISGRPESFARIRRARSVSIPPTLICAARRTVTRVSYASIASPRLPKRLPRPPFMSRKPRCRRAGARTVTLSIIAPGEGCAGLLRKARSLHCAKINGLQHLKSQRPEDSRHEREGEGAHLHACGNRGAADRKSTRLVS